MISDLLNLLKIVLWPSIWTIWMNVPQERNVFYSASCWVECWVLKNFHWCQSGWQCFVSSIPTNFLSTYSDNYTPSSSLIWYRVITCGVSQLKMVQSTNWDKNQVLFFPKLQLVSLLDCSSVGSCPRTFSPSFTLSSILQFLITKLTSLSSLPNSKNSEPKHSCCPSPCSLFLIFCNKYSLMILFYSPDIHHP